ncbi:MAG: hypothetical protein HYZ27_09260 [Deltaproteobacteria bacterium]|nr:hypothetical protein [Deltaproteobacteria bacterium]
MTIVLGTACGKGATTADAGPNSATTAPATKEAPPAAAVDIGDAHYAVCGGQGGTAAQLSPAFLDKMPACEGPDITPTSQLAALGGDGALIEGKGDCGFGGGISCHFHTSMEFVSSDKLKDDEHAVGEMHCIVPSANAQSPTVYGAHLRCKAGTTIEAGTASCSKALLAALDGANCKSGWKCCDNGTLTKPVGKQSEAEQKLRPDFRICADASIEIDCGLLHGMHGHTANVVGLGEAVTGKFGAGEGHEHH